MHSNRYFYRLLKNVHWSIGSALQSLLTPMMSWTEEPTGQTVHTWILSQKRSRLDLLQLLYQPFFSASLSPSVVSYSTLPPPPCGGANLFLIRLRTLTLAHRSGMGSSSNTVQYSSTKHFLKSSLF